MFTVSMAVGSKELAKRGVLVTRLSAAEDAATMDVLCVDKTGTITMNQLAVTGVIPLEQRDGIRSAVRRARSRRRRPTRIRSTSPSSLRRRRGRSSTARPRSRPSPSRRSTPRAAGPRPWSSRTGQRLRVMKGAVRTVAEACGWSPPAIEALEARVSASAAKGYRTLAVARGPEAGKPDLDRTGDIVRSTAPGCRRTRRRTSRARRLREDADRRCAGGRARHSAGVGLPNIQRVADLKSARGSAGRGARPSGGRGWLRRGVSRGQVHRRAAPAGAPGM